MSDYAGNLLMNFSVILYCWKEKKKKPQKHTHTHKKNNPQTNKEKETPKEKGIFNISLHKELANSC